MSTEEKTGNTAKSESDADNKKQRERSKHNGPRRRKKRFPKKRDNAHSESPVAPEVEEQDLGPGRKKRIFKRNRPKRADQDTQQDDADNSQRQPKRSRKRTESKDEQRRSNRGSKASGDGPRGRNLRRGSRRSNEDNQDNRGGRRQDNRQNDRRQDNRHSDRRQDNRQSDRRHGKGGRGRDIRAEPMRQDNAPDGMFSDDMFTSTEPSLGSKNIFLQEETPVSEESFFSSKKGQDFKSMKSAEIDFLKPHEVNEEEYYLNLPVLDEDSEEQGELMDIAGVKTHKSGAIEPYDCEDVILAKGDEVIVETERGLAIGEVMVPTTRRRVDREVPRVFRKASLNDMRQRERNLQKAAQAFSLCQQEISRLGLLMKLVEVVYLHGGNKAIFYFMAEGRIDFRQLVKELAKELHIRVEMRQIGVRDASRMIGGLGTCGLSLCCSRYIREFAPVSIRMAKDQDLVLNPEKVSGQCGRLMCCLAYEEEVYKEKGKKMPKVGKTVETPEGIGRVRDRDILRGLVRIELETENGLKTFELTDIRPVKRNQSDNAKPRSADSPGTDSKGD